jgi:hypothetical protein
MVLLALFQGVVMEKVSMRLGVVWCYHQGKIILMVYFVC